MRTYAETVISNDDQVLHAEICAVLREFNDKDESLTCHILARAVAAVWMFACIDGKFLDLFEHSWVKTSDGNIIDVYPVSTVGGPLLVDGNALSITRRLYNELGDEQRNSRYGEMYRDNHFHSQVGETVRQLRIIRAKTATH